MKIIQFSTLIFLPLLLLLSCKNLNKISKIQSETIFEYIQYGPDTIHARGISICNNKIYTANSNGFVYKYDLKNNISIQQNKIKLTELRDIVVLNDSTFISMQSNDTSFIFTQLRDSSSLWSSKNPTFFDGIDINKNGKGILMGDPIQEELQVYLTNDFGKTWKKNSSPILHCEKGEAGFAASGTNVQTLNDSTFIFVTGGLSSHFYKTSDFGFTWEKYLIPFKKSEASGPYSVYFWSQSNGISVGGDYLIPNDTTDNCFLTNDGGKTWFKPIKTSSGYKSCVIKADKILYACGTNGIDFSLDFGLNWNKLNSINTFAMAYYNNRIYATTTKGKIVYFKNH